MSSRPTDGADYGLWRYEASSDTLVHQKTDYYIPVPELEKSSASCLDWIFQIYDKSWADAPTMLSLLRAIRFIVQPQATLCWGGIERKR